MKNPNGCISHLGTEATEKRHFVLFVVSGQPSIQPFRWRTLMTGLMPLKKASSQRLVLLMTPTARLVVVN